MPIIHLTINLREMLSKVPSLGLPYNQGLEKVLNEYGKDGWAFKDVLDTHNVVFTKEVTQEEFNYHIAKQEESEDNITEDTDKTDEVDEEVSNPINNNDTEDDNDESEIEVLQEMTKSQLVVYAVEHNITIKRNSSKDIILGNIIDSITS